MQERKLKIVKLTPIALATCDCCNATFHSQERIEDDAEREMKALFELHDCEPAVVNDAGLEPRKVFFRNADPPGHLYLLPLRKESGE